MGNVKKNGNILDKYELPFYISYQVLVALMTLSILVLSPKVSVISRYCILRYQYRIDVISSHVMFVGLKKLLHKYKHKYIYNIRILNIERANWLIGFTKIFLQKKVSLFFPKYTQVE